MNKVFAIRRDGIKYQELMLDMNHFLLMDKEGVPLDDILTFYEKDLSIKDWWRPPELDFSPSPANPNGIIPEISPWPGACLILSPRAHRLLQDSLNPYGEFLPLLVEDETYQFFHCMTSVSANAEKTIYEYEGEMQLAPSYIEFDDSVADKLVFKSPDDAFQTVFCGERFKDAIESFELKGLSFDETLIPKWE